MRIHTACLRIAIAVTGLIAAAASAVPIVDLDRPGVLEQVQRDHPAHRQRIAEILRVAGDFACHTEQFGRALQAAYDARDGRCESLLMTSLPPKRRLTFTLDGIRYSSIVRVRGSEPIVIR